MAQEHNFHKVKLAPPISPKRISSTFSALKPRNNGSAVAASLEWYNSSSRANSAPQLPIPASATIITEELLLIRTVTNEEQLSQALRDGEAEVNVQAEDLDSNLSTRSDNSDDVATTSSPASGGSGSARTRGTSISFAPEVKLDDGNIHGLEEPLPRSAPRNVPGSMLSRLASENTGGNGDDENLEDLQDLDIDGIRKEGGSRSIYRDGQVRHHITSPTAHMQTTGGNSIPHTSDDKIEIHDHENEISQATPIDTPTSTTTSSYFPSSPLSEIETQNTTTYQSNGPTSEHALIASPIEFESRQSYSPSPHRAASLWPTRRSDSTRSRSYNRLTNLTTGEPRSTERRRTSRSATSSMSGPSPAGGFLAQFSRNRANVVEEAPEPDDEGQEIGDHSGWIIGRKIGYGGFSVVKEVYTMENDKRVVRAVKIVRKQPPSVKKEEENERVQAEFEHEVSIWRFLKHKYIVPLLSVYDTPFATFCITKLNQGGTLHDLLRSRRQMYGPTERGLSANLAKRYTYQLAAAIRYLHEDVRVVHRDIKLENCLLDMTAMDAKTEGGNVLLCDFGMADFIHNENRDHENEEVEEEPNHGNIGPSATSSLLSLTTAPGSALESRETTLTILGSLEYAAPELISASHTLFSPAADIWAFGVVLYTLLTGSLPFSHAMKEKLVVMIEKTQWDVAPLYSCPAVRESGVAGGAIIDLVKGCLTHDVQERWDVERVLGCRWYSGCKAFYGDGSEEVEGGWR